MSQPVAAEFLHFVFVSLSKQVLQLYGPSLNVLYFQLLLETVPKNNNRTKSSDLILKMEVCVSVSLSHKIFAGTTTKSEANWF